MSASANTETRGEAAPDPVGLHSPASERFTGLWFLCPLGTLFPASPTRPVRGGGPGPASHLRSRASGPSSGAHTQPSNPFSPCSLLQKPRLQICLPSPSLFSGSPTWRGSCSCPERGARSPGAIPSPSHLSPPVPSPRVRVTRLRCHLHPSLHQPPSAQPQTVTISRAPGLRPAAHHLTNLPVLHRAPERAFQNAGLATHWLQNNPAAP